ncbi:hypothetical protein KAT64_20085 [Klebsiella oxytoca]|uniref:hypothetical protein n=1 Tax=Klebsiella oxytoca TaxID=571 RepID=UPI0018C517CC|nr:hypothetical protein [Klebsiella oxytoca]EJV1068757.1 hypothetical protein [Klebsiella oxytoca]MBG2649375.1 hypothetical protein [Klebsiella oxytoca]QTV82211.1 hypothetical protein KAT64_20085 [Klebsiella oxytoca]
MYYQFGNITIHFSVFQSRFYVAHWDGGNVVTDKWSQFIELVTQQTGIDRVEFQNAAKEFFGEQQ